MSKPAKRQKVNLEPILRQIFIEACGGGCVNPGCTSKPGTPLQLGHIQSDKDGGPVSLDNLQPLCAKCNGGFKGFWPDYRPLDWRFRMIELWAQTLRLYPSTPYPKNEVRVDTVLSQKRVEDKSTYGWAEALFSFNSVLPLPVRYPPDPYPAAKFEDMVGEAIQLGKSHHVPIPPPDEKLRSKLMGDAKRLGQRFLLGANEFIRQEKWFDGKGQFVRRVMTDPWAVFHANVGMYVRDAERRALAQKADATKKREADLQVRWQEYKRAGECGNWPGMTDAERIFRDKASAETEVRELSSEEQELAVKMPGMEFWAKRKCCQDFINLCDQIIAASDELSGHSTDFLLESLSKKRTVAGLHELHTGIQKVYQELRQYLGPVPGGVDEF